MLSPRVVRAFQKHALLMWHGMTSILLINLCRVTIVIPSISCKQSRGIKRALLVRAVFKVGKCSISTGCNKVTSVVGCIKVPSREKYYVCFTDDFRVIQSTKFLRSRVTPPQPPARVCRVPDVLTDLGSPSSFASAVGVPCRLTVPCVIYKKIEGREIAKPSVSDAICYEAMTAIPPPKNTVAYPTWEIIEMLMDMVQHHSKFGNDIYRSCVFIGKKKAYPAPWTATTLIRDTMRALIDLGYLDKKFETEIVMKYNALEISSVIGMERFGRIYQAGFNFYGHGDKYEAVAVFWTSSDYAAKKYALRLWDMHLNYTMKIVEIMNKLPDYAKLKVENYRNESVLGVPYWRTYFETGGYSINDIGRVYEALMKSPAVGTPVDITLGDRLQLLIERVMKEVFGYDSGDEEKE